MKKLCFTLALTLLPALFFAQSAFDRFESRNEITSVVVSQKTFRMLGEVKTDKEARQFQELVSKIESFRLFSTEDATAGKDLKTAAESYAKSAKLEELMRAKEKDMNVSINVKSGAKETQITEILIFIENAAKEKQTALISITGNFDLDEISELTGKVLPTADKKLTDAAETAQMQVYPNPASGVFYIHTDQPADVKMYDLSGRLVKSQAYTAAGIAVSDLSPNTYLVEITSGDKRQTERIIIK